MKPLLEIENLTVAIDDEPLLSGVNLTVAPGEIHIVFGPNGTGKSSLIKAIMGLPPYRVTSGDVRFEGESILGLPIDERARLGVGLAFQQPPAVRDVSLSALSKALGIEKGKLDDEAAGLGMGGHINRGLNDGFSGGEQKRSELLQLLLQRPRLLLLDEPESGVDVDSLKLLTAVIDASSSGTSRSGNEPSAGSSSPTPGVSSSTCTPHAVTSWLMGGSYARGRRSISSIRSQQTGSETALPRRE